MTLYLINKKKLSSGDYSSLRNIRAVSLSDSHILLYFLLVGKVQSAIHPTTPKSGFINFLPQSMASLFLLLQSPQKEFEVQ